MSLLTALIVKSSHILVGIYFIFPKIRLIPNSKGFQYQMWRQSFTKYLRQTLVQFQFQKFNFCFSGVTSTDKIFNSREGGGLSTRQ